MGLLEEKFQELKDADMFLIFFKKDDRLRMIMCNRADAVFIARCLVRLLVIVTEAEKGNMRFTLQKEIE